MKSHQIEALLKKKRYKTLLERCKITCHVQNTKSEGNGWSNQKNLSKSNETVSVKHILILNMD